MLCQYIKKKKKISADCGLSVFHAGSVEFSDGLSTSIYGLSTSSSIHGSVCVKWFRHPPEASKHD